IFGLSGWQAGQSDLSGCRGASKGRVLVAVGAAVTLREVSLFSSGGWSLEERWWLVQSAGASCGARSWRPWRFVWGTPGCSILAACLLADVATTEHIVTSEKVSPRGGCSRRWGLLESLTLVAVGENSGDSIVIICRALLAGSGLLRWLRRGAVARPGCGGCGCSLLWLASLTLPHPTAVSVTRSLALFVVAPVCSSLTSWHTVLLTWLLSVYTWLFLPNLVEVRNVGGCVVRLWSHVVAPVFCELLCLGGCVPRVASALCLTPQSSFASAFVGVLAALAGRDSLSQEFVVDGRGGGLFAVPLRHLAMVVVGLALTGCEFRLSCRCIALEVEDCSGLVSAGCCATSGLRYAVVVLATAFWTSCVPRVGRFASFLVPCVLCQMVVWVVVLAGQLVPCFHTVATFVVKVPPLVLF
ncbi:hypothetical protein Taro_012032, partial [Colocasia esculenta]|nr:hypothetical protein [Colocasia esculenta]